MKIAVINTGSSSLKFKLFDMQEEKVLYELLVQNIGAKDSKIKNHHEAIESIDIDFSHIDVIGHRVVHGGEEFNSPTILDAVVLQKINSLSSLAPLHNPANVEGIKVSIKKAPTAIQVAVFDTAFHTTMPMEAYLYAIPYKMYEKHKIRRYGFHGTSHGYLLKECAKILNKNIDEMNIITLHLGNGASICAIKNGKSIDTSMGFTPLEGLIMGTRCGDIDPAIVLYMQRELNLSVDEVDDVLNKQSGLIGICNDNDIRKIQNSNSKESKLALAMMIRRARKYVGSYMALIGRVDAVVFSGGIGENSSYIRDSITKDNLLEKSKILVIKTDEELEIARECLKVLQAKSL
ncbi:MAG: acetate kinase [Epsilonproteobacteria bacterium]|nr:acetate kinase [Campylobacterota bacterium]